MSIKSNSTSDWRLDAAVRRVTAMRDVEAEFVRRAEESCMGADAALEALQTTLAICTVGVAPTPPAQYTDEQIRLAQADHEAFLHDCITNILMLKETLLQKGDVTIALMRHKRREEFSQIFDASLGAALDTSGELCSVVGAGCSRSQQTLRMHCCRATICLDCQFEHALLNASGSTTTCVFCRQPFAVCRTAVSAPATPPLHRPEQSSPSSPPSSPPSVASRQRLQNSPQRAF